MILAVIRFPAGTQARKQGSGTRGNRPAGSGVHAGGNASGYVHEAI
ncbi:hypothetical protein [Dyadobacter flavalbus]|nr:hypothetical protein [Dyadobacter flavalbus]